MEFSLASDKTLTIATSVVNLRGGQPVLNSQPLEDLACEVLRSDSEWLELLYTSPSLQGGAFRLLLNLGELQKQIWIRYSLEGLPDEFVLDSFGVHFEQAENVRQYLRNGYFSWDGSYYVQPDTMSEIKDAVHLETGYGMCQFLPRFGSGSLILGFDRHDRFQQTFTFDMSRQIPALTIQTCWDRKERSSLDRCESERLVIFRHPEVENGLRAWAQLVAEASPTPPRLSAAPIAGWCSWYNLYAAINEENVLEHLRAAQEVCHLEHLPMRVFQIDDGFTPEMGDWLEVKPQFPRGMKPLLDDIRSVGFIPGLWIAPFMVGNRSHLYRDHPDWVVKDRDNGQPLAHMRFYGEFRWHKRSEEYYILDTTHPGAFDYLRTVFRIWRNEWGCGYFKTDFMHFGSEYGPNRAVWHTPGMSRIEIWRRVAELIRAEIGEVLWLGCGCPLWASIGLVDGVRVGRDVGVTWNDSLAAQSLLRDQACRNFANHILWQSDPDCILLRERFHNLSEEEIKTLAIYAGMTGGVMMTSDQLSELSSKRLRLWRLILPEERVSCDFPLLGQSEILYDQLPGSSQKGETVHVLNAEDAMLVQVRHAKREEWTGAVFFLNAGSNTIQRDYSLADLGIKGPVYIYHWEHQASSKERVATVSISLSGHQSALYFFSAEPIQEKPHRLPS